MKAKINRGSGFRGVLDYALKGGELVGGNMAGGDARELAREFSAVRHIRPDCEKPVWHCSLALPPGERLSAEKWDAVAGDFLRRMGFDQATPWAAVLHQADHQHIHIIASRVSLEGKIWKGTWEARRAIEITQDLEKRYGLTQTKGLAQKPERKRPTGAEIQMAKRTGEDPPRQRLQRLVDQAVADRPTAALFATRLRDQGVGVRANIASTGKMNGFSFQLDGINFKGSDLGKKYTWKGLQARGVVYDPKKDAKPLLGDSGAKLEHRGPGEQEVDIALMEQVRNLHRQRQRREMPTFAPEPKQAREPEKPQAREEQPAPQKDEADEARERRIRFWAQVEEENRLELERREARQRQKESLKKTGDMLAKALEEGRRQDQEKAQDQDQKPRYRGPSL